LKNEIFPISLSGYPPALDYVSSFAPFTRCWSNAAIALLKGFIGHTAVASACALRNVWWLPALPPNVSLCQYQPEMNSDNCSGDELLVQCTDNKCLECPSAIMLLVATSHHVGSRLNRSLSSETEHEAAALAGSA